MTLGTIESGLRTHPDIPGKFRGHCPDCQDHQGLVGGEELRADGGWTNRKEAVDWIKTHFRDKQRAHPGNVDRELYFRPPGTDRTHYRGGRFHSPNCTSEADHEGICSGEVAF